MPIEMENGTTGCVLRLEGEAGIGSAGELKRALLDAISSGKPLQIDLGAATDLDVTAVQLLWAAARDAGQSKMPFRIGPIPEALRGAFTDAGFEDIPGREASTQ